MFHENSSGSCLNIVKQTNTNVFLSVSQFNPTFVIYYPYIIYDVLNTLEVTDDSLIARSSCV